MPSVIHSRTVPTNFWTFLGPPPISSWMFPSSREHIRYFWECSGSACCQEWGQCFYGSVSIQLGRNILVCPPADNPSHCERASWDLMHLAWGVGQGRKHTVFSTSLSHQRISFWISHGPLWRWLSVISCKQFLSTSPIKIRGMCLAAPSEHGVGITYYTYLWGFG